MVTGNFHVEPKISKNERRRIVCKTCNKETWHQVLCQANATDHNEDIQVWENYYILQCAGCDDISFEKTSSDTEDYDYDEDGNMILNERKNVYPSRLSGRSEIRKAYDIPSGIYKVYRETHSALCNQLYVLAGIGIRAIIEAICMDRKVTGNLEKKIDALASNGDVTVTGAQILHSLRFMGNMAAHKAKAHTEQELNTAFDVVENLLMNVYIIPKQASQLLPKQSFKVRAASPKGGRTKPKKPVPSSK